MISKRMVLKAHLGEPFLEMLIIFFIFYFGKTGTYQARKRNPNLNFWVRIFSGGVGVFHAKGWGPKSSVCPLKPQGTQTFGRGRGNQPPNHGPDTEIQYRPQKPHGPAKLSRILSKREANTECQYRPHIVDTDTIADAVCGRHFRDF